MSAYRRLMISAGRLGLAQAGPARSIFPFGPYTVMTSWVWGER